MGTSAKPENTDINGDNRISIRDKLRKEADRKCIFNYSKYLGKKKKNFT